MGPTAPSRHFVQVPFIIVLEAYVNQGMVGKKKSRILDVKAVWCEGKHLFLVKKFFKLVFFCFSHLNCGAEI